MRTLFVEATTRFETVVAGARSGLRVTAPGGESPAQLAVSCLVRPEVGDRVLVARCGEEVYVLAVLTRSGDEETTLAFDHDVTVHVASGRLRLASQDGVEIASPGTLDVRVAGLVTEAERHSVTFGALELVGATVTTKAKTMRLVAEAVDTIAGRIYQRTVHFFRRTDELDRVEAKNMERRAEHLLHTHAENAVTTAEHLVKVDASQVHVG